MLSASPLIRFDRRKYGAELMVDACAIADIPGFITGPTRPHRLAFHEIALVTAGSGQLEIDGTSLPFAPRSALLTRPGETRRWRLALGAREPLDGLLVFFEADFFDGFFGATRFVENLPLVSAAAEHRSLAAAPRAFDELLDERFALAESVTRYAELLHVTPRHLNACVQATGGRTASETIHERRMLEARRLLLHTGLGVGAIAERLTFSDASYFVRFFKRHAGATPREFRRRSA